MDHRLKKFLVILLGTLSLIPIILMLPGSLNSMPNRAGVVMGIIPLAILAANASFHKPWEIMSFFSGLVLIIFGVSFFVMQEGFGSIAKVAEAAKRFSKEDVRYWTEGIELWIYVISAISIAMGVNVVSTYISAVLPDSEVK